MLAKGPGRATPSGQVSFFGEFMTSDDRLLLILRRLYEIERNSTTCWTSYGPPRPSAIRHAGAIVQGRIEAVG